MAWLGNAHIARPVPRTEIGPGQLGGSLGGPERLRKTLASGLCFLREDEEHGDI